MNNDTSIRIPKQELEELKKHAIIPEEPNYKIIQRLREFYEANQNEKTDRQRS